MVEGMRYFTTGHGLLTAPAALAHAFVRTRPELESPDIQMFFMPVSYNNPNNRAEMDREPGMTLSIYQLRPESVGSIHAASADPYAAPAIRPNFLSVEEDRRCLIAGMRIGREIIEHDRMDHYRVREMSPGVDCQSDDQLLGFCRDTCQTAYHPVGTCKMGNDPTWPLSTTACACMALPASGSSMLRSCRPWPPATPTRRPS